ncbi:MAG: 3-oxoacyl-[acyl-carrier-protein] synthase III C-terminal domain-containing protein [Verrucomicrobiales bacterium]|nr:3-oxoacyl-[acyl-carrier-protein] synthase III C-terminal domain-containing protein [Verrucomicrobiales bacterium]
MTNLKPKSFGLLEKILTGDSGIGTRHFSTNDPTELFELSAGQLNHLFEQEAPAMAERALSQALDKASTLPQDLDALFVCTCTGYLCPGVSSYVAEKMGMRGDVYLQDIVGLGCGAAVPTIRSAHGFLTANPEATIGVIAVESCSSAFFIDDDFGVLISLCLFGDGASASIWKSTPGETGYRADHFHTLHDPKNREKIRFVNHEGKLRNKLHLSVPNLAGKAVKTLYDKRTSDSPHVLTHTGGRDVLSAIKKSCSLDDIPESREALYEYGNTSSPSVLIALEGLLEKGASNDNLWLTSFGAGFACHSFEMLRS